MEKQVHVSFYASLFRTECKVLTLEEIIILIRRRRWKNEILAYRTALAEGRAEEARKLKGGLPGFTPSGVFKGGHKASAIETYSQVVGLDFDHVKDLPALILTFRALSSTLAMFVSPGGEGLKVFVRVDCPAERHGEAYPLVAAFFEKAGGVASDAKCKDISRCCYVGDDGEAYYNPDAEVFHIPEKQPAEKGVDAFVARFLDRIPPLAGARNQTVYRLGCEANRRGFSYTETAACCTLRLQAADFTATEIEQALHSAYQGNMNEHATYGGAKGQIDREISPTVFKTRHPLETEEIETSGEVLRERTPLIPDEVYGWLPDLFREAVAFYPQHRERDMALLGACTVASACLPEVSGKYHRKRVFPHIFTVEVAPAANGKGCINDMRHLADLYEELIKTETGQAEAEYLQALEEWEQKKAEAHQKHRSVVVKDAPKPAAKAYLNIPTQVTKAKMLVHLRDNGNIGGLMADSEIDTILSASKQDYGMFDDLLRKAFHHEPVSSSRKTDNEMIRIDSPRLALLLSGTPGQFSRLIPDSESGLLSRLLLYTCRSEAVWQDVSPEGDKMDMPKKLSELSEQLMNIAKTLRRRPLQVCLTLSQWARLNQCFKKWLHEADLFGDEEFLSVIKRHGLIAFRLCMIFTATRCGKEGYGMDSQYCTEEHFKAALAIVETCLEHSRLLLTQLRHNESAPELSCPRKGRILLEKLPERFTLAEAYTIGETEGMDKRLVRRLIYKLNPLFIKRISHGEYQKNKPVTPQKV